MTWIIAITWTISLILTGKIAHAVGWAECMYVTKRKGDDDK